MNGMWIMRNGKMGIIKVWMIEEALYFYYYKRQASKEPTALC